MQEEEGVRTIRPGKQQPDRQSKREQAKKSGQKKLFTLICIHIIDISYCMPSYQIWGGRKIGQTSNIFFDFLIIVGLHLWFREEIFKILVDFN